MKLNQEKCHHLVSGYKHEYLEKKVSDFSSDFLSTVFYFYK